MITAAVLTSAAGILLSVLFSYIPKFNTKFAALEGTYKRLIMLGLLLVISAAAYGLACQPWLVIPIDLTCDQAGLSQLFIAFVAAVVTNQSTYAISPKTKAVKAVLAQQ